MSFASNPPAVPQSRSHSDDEVSYNIDELFYSRTDTSGRIVAGNELFRRISGYSWSELIGAPHKIVRHPDTPKGVFHILWEDIKAGRSIGAYVKNQAKDGRYYWTFALLCPVEGGFMSLRMKPSSPVFEKIKRIYAECVQQEAAQETSEESRDVFLAEIAKLGFANYSSFVSEALSQEIASRDKTIRRDPDEVLKYFRNISEARVNMNEEVTTMIKSFNTLKTVSTNMRIVAARLEDRGKSIAEISSNYGAMCDEMTKWMRHFVDGDDSIFATIRSSAEVGLFLSCFRSLQTEIQGHLSAGTNDGTEGVSLEQETVFLSSNDKLISGLIEAALAEVTEQVENLATGVSHMKRQMTGLHSTRIMCKVESAPIAKIGDTLSGIVEQLDVAQDQIEARLAQIADLNGTIRNDVEKLVQLGGRDGTR